VMLRLAPIADQG